MIFPAGVTQQPNTKPPESSRPGFRMVSISTLLFHRYYTTERFRGIVSMIIYPPCVIYMYIIYYSLPMLIKIKFSIQTFDEPEPMSEDSSSSSDEGT